MNNQSLPNTPEQRRQMLEAIGVGSVEGFFSYIPEKLRLNRPLNLPHPMVEARLMAHMEELVGRNEVGAVSFWAAASTTIFLLQPSTTFSPVPEFYTAYTPYQPEVSQGTLQAIFENADHDLRVLPAPTWLTLRVRRGTALAEAAIIALNTTRNSKILLAGYHASLGTQGPGHLYGGPGRPGGGNPRR